MSALVWDGVGQKWYETGVSKVALYPIAESGSGYGNGVAWNGVTGVTEKPTGADTTDIYADNAMYASLRSAEKFEFGITAYTYPDEWAACDGSASPVAGVNIFQQTRKTFGLTYRTEIGNDEAGDAGYIIHLLYGCTAAPSERAYKTTNESPEAIEFSWDCKTIPVSVSGYKPVAHMEIDSRKFKESSKASKLAAFEKTLYGDTSSQATLPLPAAVIAALT